MRGRYNSVLLDSRPALCRNTDIVLVCGDVAGGGDRLLQTRFF